MNARQYIDSLFEAQGLRFHVVVEFNQEEVTYEALLSRETRPDCRENGGWRITLFEPYQGVLTGFTHVNFDLDGPATLETLQSRPDIADLMRQFVDDATGEQVRGVRFEP
jgi:hypothetical protein